MVASRSVVFRRRGMGGWSGLAGVDNGRCAFVPFLIDR